MQEEIPAGRGDVARAQHQGAVTGHDGDCGRCHVPRQRHAGNTALGAHVEAAADREVAQFVDDVGGTGDGNRAAGSGRQGLDVDLVGGSVTAAIVGLREQIADRVVADESDRHGVRRRAVGGNAGNGFEGTATGNGRAVAAADVLHQRIAVGRGTGNREGHAAVVADAGQAHLFRGGKTQRPGCQRQIAGADQGLGTRQGIVAGDQTSLQRAGLGGDGTHRSTVARADIGNQDSGRTGAVAIGGDHLPKERHRAAAAVDTDLAAAGIDAGAGAGWRLRNADTGERNQSVTAVQVGLAAQRHRARAGRRDGAGGKHDIAAGGGQVGIGIEGNGPVGRGYRNRRRGVRRGDIAIEVEILVAAISVVGAGGGHLQTVGVVVVMAVTAVLAQVDTTGAVERNQTAGRDALADGDVGNAVDQDIAELGIGRGRGAARRPAHRDRPAASTVEGQIVAFAGVAVQIVAEADRSAAAGESDVVVQIGIERRHRDRTVTRQGIDGHGAATIGNIVVTQSNLTAGNDADPGRAVGGDAFLDIGTGRTGHAERFQRRRAADDAVEGHVAGAGGHRQAARRAVGIDGRIDIDITGSGTRGNDPVRGQDDRRLQVDIAAKALRRRAVRQSTFGVEMTVQVHRAAGSFEDDAAGVTAVAVGIGDIGVGRAAGGGNGADIDVAGRCRQRHRRRVTADADRVAGAGGGDVLQGHAVGCGHRDQAGGGAGIGIRRGDDMGARGGGYGTAGRGQVDIAALGADRVVEIDARTLDGDDAAGLATGRRIAGDDIAAGGVEHQCAGIVIT